MIQYFKWNQEALDRVAILCPDPVHRAEVVRQTVHNSKAKEEDVGCLLEQVRNIIQWGNSSNDLIMTQVIGLSSCGGFSQVQMSGWQEMAYLLGKLKGQYPDMYLSFARRRYYHADPS